MKQSIKVICNVVLILAIIVLAIVWMMAPAQKIITQNVETEMEDESSASIVRFEEDIKEAALPEGIAELFGWKEKTHPGAESAVSEAVADEVPIETVPHMKYVGYAVDCHGEKTHFIKNDNTGQLVSLQKNMMNNGWKLVEISERGIIAEQDDNLCLILLDDNFKYRYGETDE
jgi:hypothetical protein